MNNIVILRTDRIGEVLLSTVAVDAVKRRYPEARVSFVTSEYSRPVIEGRADIERIITVDTMKKGENFVKAAKLASSVRKGGFDTAVVLNPHRVLHLACFLAGIPRRVGYDRKWGFLLTDKAPDERDKGEKHEIEYTMELLGKLDIKDAPPSPQLSVREKSEKSVEEVLSRMGVDKASRLVAVHPGSSNPAKIWPPENYAGLIRRILSELDCRIAVIGSKVEKDLDEGIIREADKEVIDLTGALDLKELAALLKRSAVFVGNDTGPMHMAAALGTPVVAIFGRNIPGAGPKRWCPWGKKNVVFHEDPGCDPCYDTKCPYDHKCLRAVTVDAVFEAVKGLLDEK